MEAVTDRVRTTAIDSAISARPLSSTTADTDAGEIDGSELKSSAAAPNAAAVTNAM
jgi:hypothetical protein